MLSNHISTNLPLKKGSGHLGGRFRTMDIYQDSSSQWHRRPLHHHITLTSTNYLKFYHGNVKGSWKWKMLHSESPPLVQHSPKLPGSLELPVWRNPPCWKENNHMPSATIPSSSVLGHPFPKHYRGCHHARISSRWAPSGRFLSLEYHTVTYDCTGWIQAFTLHKMIVP